MQISSLATKLQALCEFMDDARIVKKFLCAMPSWFNQVAVSIEMFCNLKILSVVELVRWLRTTKDHFSNGVE
jgi:hypothetical protein